MNFKKIFGSLLIISVVAGLAFGQELKLKQKGNVVRVMRGGKFLYQVVLRGAPNYHKQKYDEAFLAGSCLIVRRDVQEDELYPKVSRLEIYQTSGKRKIYREAQLGIRRLDSFRVLTSPDFTWAVIPDEEEGEVSGYFYISPQCRISEESFPGEGTLHWDDVLGGDFIDAATLKLPSMLNELSNGQKKKVAVFIGKDRKILIQEIDQ
ncbi:MAG TPA: hypothetical protein VNB22_23995 [Pyrinomonadaceae bacterium]|jgi:hypothetical protein|nr:hypothetical protein [Pyrinomonadaceae bacterium]